MYESNNTCFRGEWYCSDFRWLVYELHLICEQFQFDGGMHLTTQQIGQDSAAVPIHAPHWPQFNLSVSANFFKNSTINTCKRMVIPTIPKNNLFLWIPLKTFFSSSFLALNSLNTWHRTKMLKIKVSFTLSVTPKMDSPLN